MNLEWMKLLQTLHKLGFNDNAYYKGYASRLPDFMCFFFHLDIRKCKTRSHIMRKSEMKNKYF